MTRAENVRQQVGGQAEESEEKFHVTRNCRKLGSDEGPKAVWAHTCMFARVSMCMCVCKHDMHMCMYMCDLWVCTWVCDCALCTGVPMNECVHVCTCAGGCEGSDGPGSG